MPHFKGEFRLTESGAESAQAPAQLFSEIIQFFVLKIDHASYARFEERPLGKWDVWMNVTIVEADCGATERALFAAFYGDEHDWDMLHGAIWPRSPPASCDRLNGLDCLHKPEKSARARMCTTYSRHRRGVAPEPEYR